MQGLTRGVFDLWTRPGLLLPLAAAFIFTGCQDDRLPTGPGGQPTGTALLTITPGSQSLSPGDSVQFHAEVVDAQGNVVDPQTISWSSSDQSVVTVDANGFARAVAEGSAIITADADGTRGTASVDVADIVICECWVPEFSDSNKVALRSVDSATGTYTFEVLEGGMPSVDSGDVVVGTQQGGFLRQVTRASTSGKMITLETTDAVLTDVVHSGSFGTSTKMDPADSTTGLFQEDGTWWGPTKTELAPGIGINPDGSIELDGLTLTLDRKFDLNPDQGTSASLSAELAIDTGDFSFLPTLDVGGRFGYEWVDVGLFKIPVPTVKEFRTIFRSGVDLDIPQYTFTVAAASKLDKSSTLRRDTALVRQFKPFATAVGPVPVIGVVEMTIKLVVTVEVKAEASWTGKFGAGFGVEGGARMRNGKWSPVFGASSRFDASVPQFKEAKASATLKIALVPELFVRFYGVAGPFANFEPFARATAELFPIPFDWRLTTDLGLNFNLGFRIDILGFGVELALSIPLVDPLLLAEIYSDGSILVTNTTSGSDKPLDYDLLLRPAFDVVDAVFGRYHSESTDNRVLITDSTHEFTSVRSGDNYAHVVMLNRVQGNCTVTSHPTLDTVVAVVSSERLALPFPPEPTQVDFDAFCIPFGNVTTSVTTTGPDQDPDGYSLFFERTDPVGVAPKYFPMDTSSTARDTARIQLEGTDATILLDSLIPVNPPPGNGASGSHELTLQGVRRNCAVARPTTHEQTVLSDDTITTQFEVQCIPLGNIRVTTATNDPDPWAPLPDSMYSVQIDQLSKNGDTTELADTTLANLAADTDQSVIGFIPLYNASLADGRHQIDLSGRPNRCTVQGTESREVTVLSAETAEVLFEVDCVERVHVQTETTGDGATPTAYEVIFVNDATLDDSTASISSSDSIGVIGIAPGSTTVKLATVPASCTVQSGQDGVLQEPTADTAIVSIEVSAIDAVVIAFNINCPPPDVPNNLSVDDVGTSYVDLSWQPPEDPNGVIARYRIYRDGAVTDSTDAPTTNYSDTDLPAFTEFTYEVTAINLDDVESGRSNAVTVRTLDDTPPSAPTGLTASAVSESQIALTWSPAGDPETGVPSYNVFRGDSAVATTGDTLFTDAGLDPSTTYTYTVSGTNGQGLEGAHSDPASATTFAIGDLEVTTSTSGDALDEDGYTVVVDSTEAQTVDVNDTVTFVALLEGDHLVELTGVADNCIVSGENPRTVAVPDGGTAATAFEITCDEIVGGQGNLEVMTSTTGDDIDADGYTVMLDDSTAQAIGVNDTFTFVDIAEGQHTVELTDVADNCTVQGDNPRSVNVPDGSTDTTTFDVTCEEIVGDDGNLEVNTSTTGDDIGADGYTVTLNDSTTQAIGVNDTFTFVDLPTGDHTVELADVAENCTVSGENPRTVSVSAGGTASTTFEVDCSKLGTGRLQVFTETTGTNLPISFTVAIDGRGVRLTETIDANGTVIFDDIPTSQRYSVLLDNIPPQCTVTEPNPRIAPVIENQTTQTTFVVSCGNE